MGFAATLDKGGRKFLDIGVVCGLAAAAVMSYLKNTTSLIHTGIWNMRIFLASLVLLILFLVFSIPKLREKLPKTSEIIICSAAALLAALLLFYEMPDVFAYPYTIRQQGYESFFSTDYLLALGCQKEFVAYCHPHGLRAVV